MSSIRRIGRRHFLAGSAGLLGVPFLTSLAPRRARAQSRPQLRLVIMGTDHGGVWPEHFYPEPGAETVVNLYGPANSTPRHDMRWSGLQERIEGGQAILSETLQAASDVLTPNRVQQMSVLRGVDVSTYLGHNRASFSGNFGANDQGRTLHSLQVQTIDQVVARHPDFNKSPVKERSLHFASSYGISSNVRHSASAARVNGSVVPVQATNRTRELWSRLFSDQGGSGDTPVIDLVYEQYRSLTRGAFGDARRLSGSDRNRLEAHLTLVSELQRKLNTTVVCDDVPQPPDIRDDIDALRIAADLYVAALRCGASNVGVITAAGRNISADGGWTNWHEQIAHNGGGNRTSSSFNPEFQRINYRAQRRFFEEVFMRIVSGLDVEEADGETYLDRSLVLWSMESGDTTHTNFSMPIVAAGTAAGFFETGRYIDFRNLENQLLSRSQVPTRHPGILINRVLGNILQGMGVPPEDYHGELQQVQPNEFNNGARGYGVVEYHRDNFWQQYDLEDDIWPRHHFNDGDVLIPGWVRDA
ncbi:MAG: DUF1552 domain-containing protein [Myxococcota bacterium]